MTQEALKLALELLAVSTFYSPELQAKRTKVIEQGLEALAQPEQEPVAWEQLHEHIAGPFYTHPTQRTWVGLFDEEIEELLQSATGADEEVHIRFARALESKLKELNT